MDAVAQTLLLACLAFCLALFIAVAARARGPPSTTGCLILPCERAWSPEREWR